MTIPAPPFCFTLEDFDKSFSVIYHALQDDISKKIFLHRFLYNLTGDDKYLEKVITEDMRLDIRVRLRDVLSKNEKKKYILFGAGELGRETVRAFPTTRWFCFADNHLSGTACGLEIIDFNELLKYKNELVLVATATYSEEIITQLLENGFDRRNVFPWGALVQECLSRQYFDLDELPHVDNEVFIDGGGFDGSSTLEFAKWTNYRYKKIYIFEPNESLKNICYKNTKSIPDVTIVNKGLYSANTCLNFKPNKESKGASCFDFNEDYNEYESDAKIPVVAIDDFLRDENVTFIKLDIEGSELNALIGAEKTIKTYRPKIAVCLYHKKEDLWKIPLLLLKFNPNYKFWIRHYSFDYGECVLYAF